LGKRKHKTNSIDLIVTSPPYNVGIDYENSDDTISYEEYLKWTEKVCRYNMSCEENWL